MFLLRCVELGLSMDDLDVLTMGMIYDMMTEKANDQYQYPIKSTQTDFDRF